MLTVWHSGIMASFPVGIFMQSRQRPLPKADFSFNDPNQRASCNNAAILNARWNDHGRRLEVSATDLDVLEELDLLLVGIDRPSYGSSDPHPNR